MLSTILARLKEDNSSSAHDFCTKATEAFCEYAQELASKRKDTTKFLETLHRTRDKIINLRDHQPAIRTALHFLFDPHELLGQSPAQIATTINKRADTILVFLNVSRQRVGYLASKKIKNGMTILTHSHSTHVIEALRIAYREGKRFHIIALETRPLQLGRQTAQDLARIGVPVHYCVDGAMHSALKRCDLVLLGCDLIDHEQGVYEQIGCELIASVAQHEQVPVYVCTDSLKYDARHLHHPHLLANQDTHDVWNKPPKGVLVEHFSYERITPSNITGVICELGILSTSSFSKEVEKAYPEWFTH